MLGEGLDTFFMRIRFSPLVSEERRKRRTWKAMDKIEKLLGVLSL